MKKSRFTDSQIMAILKQYEAGGLVRAEPKPHDISTTTSELCVKYARFQCADIRQNLQSDRV